MDRFSLKALDTNADGYLNELEYETAVTAAPATNEPAANAPATDAAATTTQPATTAPATTATLKTGPASYLDAAGPNDVLASKLIGMRIYALDMDIDACQTYPADARKDWDDVGEVLGVGGFLGMGEKDVAIEMASLRKVRESNDATDWFLVVNTSKEMLTNAPAYTKNTKS